MYGTLRVTSRRAGGLKANATERVIPCDRRCKIFGNPHILHNHNDPKERAHVIAAFKTNADKDFAQKGPIYKRCVEIANLLKTGQNVALECWCTVPPPQFRPCHGHLLETKILEILKTL
jgi:hypothetical protein